MSITTDNTAFREVASTIRSQIGALTLMSLGATDLGSVNYGLGGLAFRARILPFNADGARSEQPRALRVLVTLNSADLYDVAVEYARRGKTVTHARVEDIDARQLSRTMLALDYDGETVLNPRLV